MRDEYTVKVLEKVWRASCDADEVSLNSAEVKALWDAIQDDAKERLRLRSLTRFKAVWAKDLRRGQDILCPADGGFKVLTVDNVVYESGIARVYCRDKDNNPIGPVWYDIGTNTHQAYLASGTSTLPLLLD